jgi:RHS repeat-associated protein
MIEGCGMLMRWRALVGVVLAVTLLTVSVWSDRRSEVLAAEDSLVVDSDLVSDSEPPRQLGEPSAAMESTAEPVGLDEVEAPVWAPEPTPTSPFEPPTTEPVPDSPAADPPSPQPTRELTGFDPETSVEVVAKRDAFSTTFRNVDGTETVWLSSVPVHFANPQGGWEQVDNRVILDEDGVLVSAANEWQARFEPMTSGGGVTIATPDGDVRFVAEGASLVAPMVEPDGVSVRYVDVFPDTDLVYRVTGVGVEELLILKSDSATASVSFAVDGAQFDPRAGGLDARGGGIGERLRLSAPETFGADGRPVDVANQVFAAVDLPGGDSRVRVGLTDEFVESLEPDQFPVVVDPSVLYGFGADFVRSYAVYNTTGAAYATYDDGYARVGNPYLSATSPVRWRSTARFNYHNFFGANVVDAFVETLVVDGTTNGAQGLKVWWASQDGWHWWANPLRFPEVNPFTKPAVSDTNWSQPLVSSSLSSDIQDHWGGWLRDTYNRWTRESTPNGTLLFTGNETAGAYTFKKFAVVLGLTLNRWPTAPTGSATRRGRWVSSSGVSASDPDNDSVSYVHRLRNTVTGQVIDYGGSWAWTPQNWGTVEAPADWTGQTIEMQALSWDGMCWTGECHTNGPTVVGTFINTPPSAPTLNTPSTGTQTHNFTQELWANVATDPQSDPLTYQFFSCTDAACTTRQMFAGTPTVAGGKVFQTVTFSSAFYGQQLWWGVMAQDDWPTQTFSGVNSITFTNAAPTAALVSPVNTALLTDQMPLLTAQVTDTDDLAVNYRFEVTPTGGTGIIAASPWASVTQSALGAGASVTFQMPAWLSSKTGYSWKLLVKDPNGAAGTSSTWTLTPDSRLGPDPASPMQQIGPVQVNLATGNLYLAAGGGKSVDTVGGPISVGLAYNSHDRSALGLRGTYYVESPNGNGAPDEAEVKMVRTDSMPAFSWGSGSPAESVQPDNFRVRWEGTLRVPTAGDWLLAGGRDDDLKITIIKNGGAPIEVYNTTCCLGLGDVAAFTGTPIALSPTDNVRIQIDYAEYTGDAYVEFRAKRTTASESLVTADWFSVSDDQVLPTGWTLSVDSGQNPVWTKTKVGENEFTATAVDGSQTVWTKDVRTVNGAKVTSWVAPPGVDEVAAVNSDGTATITAADGRVYQFDVKGSLLDVTLAADTLKPAGANRVYSPGTYGTAVPRLVRLEDRIAPTRAIVLRYNQAGLGPCPAAPAGFDAAPPAGMLCEIVYPDDTSTRLFYSSGLLARISDPGDETASGVTPAPEGRSITDLVWSSGRLTYVYTPPDMDRIAAQDAPESKIPAAERIPSAELRTEVTWPGPKPTQVTLPTPVVGQPRPAQTITYTNATTTTVQVAGLTGNARTVTFDPAGRILTDKDAVNRVTSTTWANGTDAVLRTVAGGRTTSTVYDAQWHATDIYGPALSTCFSTAAPPVATQYTSYPPSGSCPPNDVPHTHADYDHNLRGLQGVHWSSTNFTGAPAGNAMGPNSGGDINYTWTDPAAPAGVTNPDNWTARYTGLFYPAATGNYVFRLTSGSNDSATLYLNDVAQLRTSPGTSDIQTGTIILNSTEPLRVRIDFKAGTGTSSLRLGYGFNGAPTSVVTGNLVKPGFGYSTRVVADDTSGSTQVPAQVSTETRYDEGIDPVYGIVTSTTVDPGGLALKTSEAFEAPGTGSLLRRTRRSLPAFSGNPASTNSTTYEYYPLSPAGGSMVANPCVAGSLPVDQGGGLRFRTDPTPAGGLVVKTETVYDILGRPVASRYVGEPAWTCTTYDARGRVIQVTIPPSPSEPVGRTITTTYRVDGDPYITAVTDPAGTIRSTVDALGRVVETVDVWGVTTASVYDQAGRLITATTTIAAPAYTSTSTYQYDTVGRLTKQWRDGLVVATPAYNGDGQSVDPGVLTSVTYPSGSGRTGNGTRGVLGYDTLGRVSSLTWTKLSTGAAITSDTLVRSLSGNVLTSTIDAAGTPTWSYTYDGVSRLVRATGSGHDFQYGYATSGGCGASAAAGKNSNRTSVTDNGVTVATFCYDRADRLTSTTQPGYTGPISYDTHGNTTTLAGETYTYDAADRHLATTTGTVTVAYQRDAADRIVARTETPAGGTPTTYRYGYTGPGDNTALTLTTTMAVTERTISLPGGVTYTARGAASVWSYPNLHGDVVAIANQTGIKQGTTILYDPYGNLLGGALPDNQTGSLDNGWLGQHQRPTEHATGLVATIEMGARPYNPTLGRFLTTDPIEGGTPNPYVYVDDPINQFDLSGMFGWSDIVNGVKSVVKAGATWGTGWGQAKLGWRAGKWGAGRARAAGSFFGRVTRQVASKATNLGNYGVSTSGGVCFFACFHAGLSIDGNGIHGNLSPGIGLEISAGAAAGVSQTTESGPGMSCSLGPFSASVGVGGFFLGGGPSAGLGCHGSWSFSVN